MIYIILKRQVRIASYHTFPGLPVFLLPLVEIYDIISLLCWGSGASSDCPRLALIAAGLTFPELLKRGSGFLFR